MRIYLYTNHHFPDAVLISWQHESTPLACTCYKEQENRKLRSLTRLLLGHTPYGICSLSGHLPAEDLSYALCLAMLLEEDDLPFSVLVVGKADLEGKLTFNTPPYQFGQVARRYHCSLVLVPPETKATFPEIRRCTSLVDAYRKVLSFKPSLDPSRYPLWRVQGLDNAKRALLLSLAGRLHLLLVGPPGSGKTFLLSEADGFLTESASFWIRSTMNAQYLLRHHVFPLTAGGRVVADELPFLRQSALETLRAEMDENTQLLVHAAMNHCPCAAMGMAGKTCTCTEKEKQRYWSKVGNPLLDRFDLKVSITPTPDWALSINTQVADWKERIQRCHAHKITMRMCTQTILQASRSSDLSFLTVRGRYSFAKTAITIAEWEGNTSMTQEIFQEALSYKQFNPLQ